MFFSFFKELYPKHISWRSALLEISLENWDLSTEDKYRSTDQRERLARTDCLMAHSRQRNKTIKRKKKKKNLVLQGSLQQLQPKQTQLLCPDHTFNLLPAPFKKLGSGLGCSP